LYSYDSEILAAVSAPSGAIPDVIATLQTIDGLCTDLDGLKWFNRLYLQVTEAVRDRCAAGGFHDAAWLAALDVQFSGLYFAALRAELSGGWASGSWRALFDRRDVAAITRIQFALAGVNAHINRDLPVAIGAACQAAGVAPSHESLQYADYTSLNSTLESLVEIAKQELAVRLPGDALPGVSHLEDTIAGFSVTAAREAAWSNAEVLWALRGIPSVRDRALDALDGMAAFAGKTLLSPVPVQV
jgi:hypothetical protein